MKRVKFSNTVDQDKLKRLKIIAVETDKNISELLDEAFDLLIDKYEKDLPAE